MELNQIRIPREFKEHPPSRKKIKEREEMFQENLNEVIEYHPIIVNKQGKLIDGYVTYLTVRKFKRKDFPILIEETKHIKFPFGNYKAFIVGKHKFPMEGHNDSDFYTWRIPKQLNTHLISVGDEVEVETKYGNQIVIVNKIIVTEKKIKRGIGKGIKNVVGKRGD